MELPSQPLTVDELVTRMRSEHSGLRAIPAQRLTDCEGAISVAQQNAEIGAEPPLRPWQGGLRPVARAAARAVLYLSRFITEAQMRFNANILTALNTLVDDARRFEATSTAQVERTDSRLLDLERALWRLRGDVARMDLYDARRGIGQGHGLGQGLELDPDLSLPPTRSPYAASRVTDAAADIAALDELYVALEDRFRGPRAEIKERLRAYLPVLDAAGIRAEDQLLDIGCGRGEWLELLRERGLNVQGVDSNGHMIARCRALDLDSIHVDAIAFLRGLPRATAAVLTAFHVAEHLPFPTLVALFDEAARVLRPDGVLLIETPNPDYPQTVTRDFYLDPTHRHPLPPALLTFIAEAKGFDRIAVVSAQPNQPALDYALIARRP